MRRLLLATLLFAVGCGSGEKAMVVLSNVPTYSVALDLCDSCSYYVVVRGGGHMHFYEPTPRDQAMATSSCAFVRVKGLDEWARGWNGTGISLPDPHFWLYREGVETVADSLSAALERCQSGKYDTTALGRFKDRVDSLFSSDLKGRVCASSFAVSRFLSSLGLEVPCVLQSEEFREPSPAEVEKFLRDAREVGVVVRDTADVLPRTPKGIKIVVLNIHPKYGERYTEFLKRNVSRLRAALSGH